MTFIQPVYVIKQKPSHTPFFLRSLQVCNVSQVTGDTHACLSPSDFAPQPRPLTPPSAAETLMRPCDTLRPFPRVPCRSVSPHSPRFHLTAQIKTRREIFIPLSKYLSLETAALTAGSNGSDGAPPSVASILLLPLLLVSLLGWKRNLFTAAAAAAPLASRCSTQVSQRTVVTCL